MTKTILAVLITFGFNFGFYAQGIHLAEETEISGGAEYSIYFEKMMLSGKRSLPVFNGAVPKKSPYNINAITTYDGITFDEDEANNGSYYIPPDPMGAAGPDNLVSVVNRSIELFSKAGVQKNSQRLGYNGSTAVGSFFESLSPTTSTFDPKVIYDQYAGRFLVVALERMGTTDDDPGNISRILLAVTAGSDPNGTWYYHAIDSKLTISGGDSWADYPGFAVDEEAIYICANMFRFSGGSSLDSRVWIIAKSPFYSGSAASVTVYAQGTEVGIGTVPTTQPAHMFGTPSSSTLGTFLISSGWTAGSIDALSVIQVNDPLGSPTFTNTFVSLGDIHNPASFPDAPQLGTSTLIETNDSRALHAVWRNDILWVTNCVIPPSGTDMGQVTAHWYKIGTSISIALSDQGNIGGESIATGCYTFFPSIAVNSTNDVCVGFSASASTIYPGCYYTGRLSSDPAGTTITPDIVRAGVDYYVRTFGSGRNRWGDYSGTSVDPSDDQTFYVFNEYALTRGTIISSEDGRWGTAFGVVPVTALPVELSSFTANVINNDVYLTWRTETEINNYGFEIQKSVASSQNSEFKSVGFVGGNGNSNFPIEYSFKDENLSPGNYSYRLKQIDNDGSFKYSNTIDVNVKDIPGEFVLEQNYPNPFNPITKVQFQIADPGLVCLKIYNALGVEITTLVNEKLSAGNHEIEFDGRLLPSGIYFYKLQAGKFTKTMKMILLK